VHFCAETKYKKKMKRVECEVVGNSTNAFGSSREREW
jgi:hypothetical protein